MPTAAAAAAEREGFEPSNEVDPRYAISSRARSTAPAPLLALSSPGRVAAAWLSDLPGASAKDGDLALQAGDDRTADDERLGGSHDAVRPLRVRRAEDLLRGEVRHVPDAVHRLEAGGHEVRGREQPDGEVGAGAAEAQRVEAPR